MKQLLMVSYHYPPDGSSSGVLRTSKFSKYLSNYGWLPHILTVKEGLYSVTDYELIGDIPSEAVVYRTLALDSARHLAVNGHHLAIFTIPDRYVTWFPFGAVRGLLALRKAPIRALYSTSPPPTAHLIAAFLKVISGLPWVADFRDPWIEEGIYPLPGTLRFRLEAALERLIVRKADRLIVTTPLLRKDFLARYPELPADKIKVIYNGYDEADFAALRKPAASGRFEILHAGLVTPEFRDPFPVLNVVSSLIANADLLCDEVQVTFLGGGSYTQSAKFREQIAQLRLDKVVKVSERISHKEALQRSQQATVLLLLQASDDTRSLIPAKAFEYLRSGRPIIALTFEGSTANLLKGMNHCFVVSPNDESRLRCVVMSLYRAWRRSPDGMEINSSFSRYERSNLTGELASVLEELVANNPGTRA
jgi:glycosyltransferase involved in cell wall biosynthesis